MTDVYNYLHHGGKTWDDTRLCSHLNHGDGLRYDKRLTVDGNNDKGAFFGGRAVSAPPPHEQIPIKNAPWGVFLIQGHTYDVAIGTNLVSTDKATDVTTNAVHPFFIGCLVCVVQTGCLNIANSLVD